ncbi:aminodeoxychorismate/anthranilate synthase component II [Halosquirtibacter laminarini]|uniref:Aminodeoxychorismate/anthranilate synthase component II n=1 Tax=Halosquirtibacter laminarini TaxID=3374600 RepID=A0AC61NIM3_9BACT|nr:aminodeoxychorismate/anthranilate synthase component II [Prolixibacteraceae bacterium]
MKIVIIDNYDSFTYNLVHLLKEIEEVEISVLRNDKFELEDLESYDKILLSPGPGIPSEAGLLMETIKAYSDKKPILGICLGHQAIGEYFGATLENLSTVYHGIQSEIMIDPKSPIFQGLDKLIKVGRYHSWAISNIELPECLEIIAKDENEQIMAIQHKELDIIGVQFHPESVLTPEGETMIRQWVKK